MAKANGKHFRDAKTARFLALGPKTWAEALAYSLAVPGQARLLEHGPAQLAAGGWVDPAPTLVLKNLGCETVIYVTRQGADSPFAESLARDLGMTAETERTLFTEAPALSLAAADGVWCTNWDGFETTQIAEASEDSFSAPFEVRHSGLETRSFVPYENAKENAGLKGCAAGP